MVLTLELRTVYILSPVLLYMYIHLVTVLTRKLINKIAVKKELQMYVLQLVCKRWHIMSVHALKLPQTSRNILKHVYDGLTYMSTYVCICIYMFLIHANTVIRSERTVTMTPSQWGWHSQTVNTEWWSEYSVWENKSDWLYFILVYLRLSYRLVVNIRLLFK